MDYSKMQFLFKISLLIFLFDGTIGLWWSLGHNDPLVSLHRICRRMRKLRGPQKTLCRREPQVIEEVIRGSAIALHHCGIQFESQRWNCSLHKRSLKRILKQDSKEAAILNAFVAAGVTHAVADSCTRGKLAHCSCTGGAAREKGADQEEQRSRRLSTNNNDDEKTTLKRARRARGCVDPLRYGLRISRRMSEARRRRTATLSDVRTTVRRHNSEVGRKAVISNMHNVCKCHGLSGSCSFKTCTLRLPSMSMVAKVLYKKYFKALKVISANDGKKITAAEGWRKLRKDDLAYLEDSPNFCRRNLRLGTLGTRGRECNATASPSLGGCELLCCGKGYNTRIEEVEENCNCKFRFCCEVTCEKCHFSRTKTYCN